MDTPGGQCVWDCIGAKKLCCVVPGEKAGVDDGEDDKGRNETWNKMTILRTMGMRMTMIMTAYPPTLLRLLRCLPPFSTPLGVMKITGCWIENCDTRPPLPVTNLSLGSGTLPFTRRYGIIGTPGGGTTGDAPENGNGGDGDENGRGHGISKTMRPMTMKMMTPKTTCLEAAIWTASFGGHPRDPMDNGGGICDLHHIPVCGPESWTKTETCWMLHKWC